MAVDFARVRERMRDTGRFFGIHENMRVTSAKRMLADSGAMEETMLSKAIAAGALLSGAFLPHQSDGSDEYQLVSGTHGFIVATLAPPVPSDGVLSVISGVRMTRVRLNTGVVLQVAESGPADGNPVLFLAVPKASLPFLYPDVAHAPHWEQPDRFAADLNAFLNSSGGGA